MWFCETVQCQGQTPIVTIHPCALIIMRTINKSSEKFVRKKRIYIRWHKILYPLCWIEFLKDGSFSIGLISNKINFTEYGSAVQRGLSFKEHVQTIQSGNLKIQDAQTPHYTFHPPRINQDIGLVHMVDMKGKVDEWNFDWFPVNKTRHILTLNTGPFEVLGSIQKPKKNYSIIGATDDCFSLRMDMFIAQIGANIELDKAAIDNVIGGCKYYNLICSFYKDNETVLCWYVANEM